MIDIILLIQKVRELVFFEYYQSAFLIGKVIIIILGKSYFNNIIDISLIEVDINLNLVQMNYSLMQILNSRII